MSSPYDEGSDAYDQGIDFGENPYDPDEPDSAMLDNWIQWRFGWLEAQDAVKEARNKPTKALKPESEAKP